jgi:diaminopimelate epimerase
LGVGGVASADELTLSLPLDDGRAIPVDVLLSGFLVFTGEPHLVLIEAHGLSCELADRIFPAAEHGSARCRRAEAESDRLVHRLGRGVNERHRELFPQGVHLDFARVRRAQGVIEYRTYERAIDRETLACGSGAVAIVAVARRLGLVSGKQTTLWPHRCRRHDAAATLTVTESESGFVLHGRPRLVYSGVVARGAFA